MEELGAYQLQIFISLIVILGAAFVALICDMLKGNNEQLRELNIELKVRREEEQKRFQMLLPQMAHAGQATARLGESKKHVAAPVGAGSTPSSTTAVSTTAVSTRDKQRAISPEAVAVMERGAKMASTPRPRAERPEKELVKKAPETQAAPEIEMVAEALAKSKPAGSRDWGSLLSAQRNPPVAKAVVRSAKQPDLLDAVVAATASDASAQAAEPSLPSGFQDGFVLTRLVESRQPVSGLVVSIGANASRGSGGSLPSNVRALIQSLIGPGDFAAQSGNDEFLLIFPSERGASAQRRLSQVAQQLWDFQLRSLGSFSILFSWGGVEVRSESIDEAIASATERMEETRRGRKNLSLGSIQKDDEPLAKAV